MRKRRRQKPSNPVAATLANAMYRKRVVESIKRYKRQRDRRVDVRDGPLCDSLV